MKIVTKCARSHHIKIEGGYYREDYREGYIVEHENTMFFVEADKPFPDWWTWYDVEKNYYFEEIENDGYFTYEVPVTRTLHERWEQDSITITPPEAGEDNE